MPSAASVSRTRPLVAQFLLPVLNLYLERVCFLAVLHQSMLRLTNLCRAVRLNVCAFI